MRQFVKCRTEDTLPSRYKLLVGSGVRVRSIRRSPRYVVLLFAIRGRLHCPSICIYRAGPIPYCAAIDLLKTYICHIYYHTEFEFLIKVYNSL